MSRRYGRERACCRNDVLACRSNAVRTDRLSSDTPTPTNAATATESASVALHGKGKRWIAWGPGSSAALSVVCFVVILGAVVGAQRSGQNRATREDIAQTALERAG